MIDKREITPELLARLTVVVFREASIKAAVENRHRFDRMSVEQLRYLMLKDSFFHQSQSIDSCEALAHSVIDYVTQKTQWQSGRIPRNKGCLNIFDLLLLVLQDLLIMNANQLECRYEEIFSWRLLAQHLGEELSLSAGYAQWDYEHQKQERSRYDDFSWPYVTRHNNKQLNMLVRRGISEHHCHLWGSTPYFHVSWVNLMNRLTDSTYRENLRKMAPTPWSAEAVQRKRLSNEDASIKEYYWELAQARAAWIRVYLCCRITQETIPPQIEQILPRIKCYDGWRQLLMSRDSLESILSSYAHNPGAEDDYALAFARLQKTPYPSDYQILLGERWLYYSVFRDYCLPEGQRALSSDDYQLFFTYFLIRMRIRDKMVQNNDIIGFQNFKEIQNRKDFFLGDPHSERIVARLAINDTLKKQYMRELEVRITPSPAQVLRLEKSARSSGKEDFLEQFLKNRSEENRRDCTEDELTDRFYYVFHFIKSRDPSLEPDASYERSLKTDRICRHEKQRRSYLKQAKTIMRFREEQPIIARRVLGIDAASKEIGCRPEVFGTVFRLLGEHQVQYGGYTEEKKSLPMLGKTFHVGEDFADIVDGLRAIDEVINFLNFDCGDRLGHALALGVDVEEWYQKKDFSISMSIQDYLDNLAWLYHALSSNALTEFSAIKEHVVQDFEYWFRIVYRNSIKDTQISEIMRSAIDNCYSLTGEDNERYHEHTCHFDIDAYYQAWMLRGDDPSCYINGYFKKPFGYSKAMNSGANMSVEERAKVCTNYPLRYENRYISDYSLLNYLYQFNHQVRREGSRKITVRISPDYVRAARAVQIAMRYRIAKKGIAVESNPTSNVLIGTFREYEKHPMMAFYNRGLPVNEAEEEKCAQLQVSINTDDSGVFYTNLEMEYALLARSVEKLVDANGRTRFKKADINNWLDNIRVMGNEQTFRYQE